MNAKEPFINSQWYVQVSVCVCVFLIGWVSVHMWQSGVISSAAVMVSNTFISTSIYFCFVQQKATEAFCVNPDDPMFGCPMCRESSAPATNADDFDRRYNLVYKRKPGQHAPAWGHPFLEGEILAGCACFHDETAT